MNQQYGRDAVNRRMRGAAQGAYGDYGLRVEEAVARGDQNRQINQMVYGGLSDAYNKAGGMFESARGAQMDADKFNVGNQQFAADYGMRANDQRFQQGLGLASAYGSLADSESQRKLAAGSAMGDDASRRMAYQQSALDTQYSDFMQKQLWDQQQTSWLTNILYGNPESVQTTYGMQYSSPLAQGLGLVAAGTGLYGKSQGT